MKNSLASPDPLVIPLEALSAATGLLPYQANRFSMPLRSYEKSRNSKTSRMAGNTSRTRFVPVIVGALGQNCIGDKVAHFIADAMAKRKGVETGVIELKDLANANWARAEAMIFVVPEYNYGFPDVLKNVLECSLPERASRVVGICDLSPGWFGGARLLQGLLPLMRKSGLIPIFWDENRPTGEEFFDTARCERIASFLNQILWMATMLRQHREACLPN